MAYISEREISVLAAPYPAHIGEDQESDFVELMMRALSARFNALRFMAASHYCLIFNGEELSRGLPVLIEVLSEEGAEDEQQVELFYREAASAARLEHPHICRTKLAEPIATTHFRVIEQIRQAETLRDLLARQGWLELDQVRQIMLQVTSALGYMWRNGILHLNLQPENILLDTNGEALVSGFGIPAQADEWMLRARAVRCSPSYRSPEQVLGKPGGSASDIYALGVMGYEMLTDRIPFDSNDLTYLKQQHLVRPPQPPHQFRPETPLSLSNLVMGLIARQPELRLIHFGDAEQFITALRQIKFVDEAYSRSDAPVVDLRSSAVATPKQQSAPYLHITPFIDARSPSFEPAKFMAARTNDTLRQTLAMPRPVRHHRSFDPARQFVRTYWLAILGLLTLALMVIQWVSSGRVARTNEPAAIPEVQTDQAASNTPAAAAAAETTFKLPPASLTNSVKRDQTPMTAKGNTGHSYEGNNKSSKVAAPKLVGGVAYELFVKRARFLLPASLRRRATGVVNVEVVINERGEVTAARALSGPYRLRPWAEAAAQEWKFDAPRMNGDPVQVVGHLHFDYR